MPGRTHGKHAIPITYGYKVSVWISELLTGLERLEEAEKKDLYGYDGRCCRRL